MVPISQKSSAAVLSLQNVINLYWGISLYNGHMRCALFGDHYFCYSIINARAVQQIKDLKILPKIV